MQNKYIIQITIEHATALYKNQDSYSANNATIMVKNTDGDNLVLAATDPTDWPGAIFFTSYQYVNNVPN